jgi:hypothetical protein
MMVKAHRGIAAVIGAGLVLRVLVLVAYPLAFWYTDSSRYVEYSARWQPDFVRQAGYSMLLKVLRRTGTLLSVSVVQQLLVLTVAVGLYALLVRRGLPKWLAAVSVVPMVFDGYALTVGHYVLADTLFLALVVGGLIVLLWSPRPTVVWAAVGGVLLAGSATVRAVSLPLLVVAVVVLVVRRVGWRPVVGFAASAALLIGGYAVWFHRSYGEYSFSTFAPSFLYGRVAPFADCDRLELTAAERRLCPAEPLGDGRRRNDWYVWNPGSAGQGVDDATKQSFVVAVVTQQPLDAAWVILDDTSRYLVPRPTHPDWVCTNDGLLLPAEPPRTAEYAWCSPNPRQAFSATPNPATMPPTTALTRALGGYAHTIQTPRLVLGLSVLLVLAAAIWRPRRRIDGPSSSEAILLGAFGLGLLVLSVAGSMFDERYGVPSVAILPAAGALAAHRLHRLWRASKAPAPRLIEASQAPPTADLAPSG